MLSVVMRMWIHDPGYDRGTMHLHDPVSTRRDTYPNARNAALANDDVTALDHITSVHGQDTCSRNCDRTARDLPRHTEGYLGGIRPLGSNVVPVVTDTTPELECARPAPPRVQPSLKSQTLHARVPSLVDAPGRVAVQNLRHRRNVHVERLGKGDPSAIGRRHDFVSKREDDMHTTVVAVGIHRNKCGAATRRVRWRLFRVIDTAFGAE